jgi:hypothetical protein
VKGRKEDVVKKLLSGACAAVLALSLSATVPAASAPIAAPQGLPAYGVDYSAELHEVQYRPRRGGPRARHFHRRGDHVYFRGHRGYRYYRPGYRRYGEFWFPPAAFIAGAILGGALAAPPRAIPPRTTYSYGPRHVEWCYARYRSYRSFDNTFQPYHGPRRQCRSPYM